jgi:predicted lipid carrier protein YhbT
MGPTTDEMSLPAFVRRLLPAAIGFPLGPVLTLSLRSFARRRPEIFDRLGAYCSARYLIDPTDLPFVFVVVPNGVSATVQIASGSTPETPDVVLRGPIMALLGIVDGTFDGDALFFHRTISITGRTEAIVALRNAIEDAELQPSDLLGLKGAAANIANSAILGGFDIARGAAASAAHRQTERT